MQNCSGTHSFDASMLCHSVASQAQLGERAVRPVDVILLISSLDLLSSRLLRQLLRFVRKELIKRHVVKLLCLIIRPQSFNSETSSLLGSSGTTSEELATVEPCYKNTIGTSNHKNIARYSYVEYSYRGSTVITWCLSASILPDLGT
jgi:hypothetical protein